MNPVRDLIEKILLSHVHPDPMDRHGVLAHIDLIGDKIWVQTDGTEAGVAHELVEAGISPQQIVLGYRIPEILPHTGFAVV